MTKPHAFMLMTIRGGFDVDNDSTGITTEDYLTYEQNLRFHNFIMMIQNAKQKLLWTLNPS